MCYWYVYVCTFCDKFLEGKVVCTVVDALIFMSGTDHEPPLGFPHEPKVAFLHGSGRFCTASTCDLQLRLPTVHEDYNEFKSSMVLAFKGNDGFGGGI